jgi:hypothetical protein
MRARAHVGSHLRYTFIALVEKGKLDGLTHAGEQLTPSSLAVCLQGATRSACCTNCVSGEN